MLPYWHFPTYTIFGLTLQTWGTFVVIGILVAIWISLRRAKRMGFEVKQVWDLAFWVILASFVCARLGYVFFYEWDYFREHLADILKIWQGGFSSYGGFIGAVAAFAFGSRNRARFREPTWADVVIAGFPLGWAIGRIGCFFIHDHPGIFTNFFLGVNYPDGIRHDLGFYDGLNALGLAIFIFLTQKWLAKKPGAMVAVVAIWYGVVRFFLDFLRDFEPRYFNLTPAQYGSIILVLFGLWMVGKKFYQKTDDRR